MNLRVRDSKTRPSTSLKAAHTQAMNDSYSHEPLSHELANS